MDENRKADEAGLLTTEGVKYLINKFERMILFHGTSTGCEFSKFIISLNDRKCFNNQQNMYFYYKKDSTKCFLYMENGSRSQAFSYGVCEVPTDILTFLSEPAVFRLSWSHHEEQQNNLLIKIFIHEKAILTNIKYAAQLFRYYAKTNVKRVIEFFYGIHFKEPEIATVDLEAPFDIPSKYIGNCYNSDKNVIITHESLIYSLRPYQSQAVDFMLQCEAEALKPCDNETHMLFTEIKLISGSTIYFHKFYGFFVQRKFGPLPKCRGGILADEMGTGKTLDVIACILLNPRKDLINSELCVSLPEETDSFPKKLRKSSITFECLCGLKDSYGKRTVMCIDCGLIQHPECVLASSDVNENQYVCPYCLTSISEYVVKSRATLIVAPSNIIDQWEEEICKHVKNNSLKILKYQGLCHHKFMSPTYIADHDIVLISYETLKKEINYANVVYGEDLYRLRYAKKFRCLPTPLLSIQWWRVCLDEAQMFESCQRKASQIVLQLDSVNNWCISGTPIQQSYQDFFWYFLFLGYDPYHIKHWFNVILWDPFRKGKRENFFSVLRKILWRTQKKDVISQMGVPPQEIVITELEFTPVERVYYEHVKQQRKRSARGMLNAYAALGEKGKLIDRTEISVILKPLRNLHLSCDSITGVSNRNVTQSELYENMLKISVVECSEQHRKLISSMNGVAGILTIMGEHEQAAEVFNNVLHSVEENKENIQTDTLQQIHALHNYCELMENELVSGDNLEACRSKIHKLNQHYLRKYEEGIANAYRILKEHNENANVDFSSWWIEILNSVSKESQDRFIERLKLILTDAPGKSFISHFGSIADRFTEISGLKYYLINAIKDLRSTHETLLKSVKDLRGITTEESHQSVSCHLRPYDSNRSSRKCKLCKTDELFKQYESKLFCFNEQPILSDEDDGNNRLRGQTFETLRRGTHADSELEVSLKFFITFFRSTPACESFVEEGVEEIKFFEVYKKEFKALRNAWMKTSDFISALDELEMAKMSIRIRYPDEEPQKPPVPYIIELDQVDSLYKNSSESVVGLQSEFKNALGKVMFLKHLRNAYFGGNAEKEPCPVCREEFADSWYVLQCGHFLCFDCCKTMTSLTRSIVNCPVCRTPSKIKEMYHVHATKMDEDLNVQGQFSTKITAVLKCLLKINKEDPTSKTLVFSAWNKVLNILDQGLADNGLLSICASEKKFFYENVKAFKDSSEINILLLPYQFGSKGLNIVEATNVILVEPSITKANMLQAVGRVHRIGQTKKTTVHMFYMKGTIDEKIYILQQKDNGLNSKIKLYSKDIIYLYD